MAAINYSDHFTDDVWSVITNIRNMLPTGDDVFAIIQFRISKEIHEFLMNLSTSRMFVDVDFDDINTMVEVSHAIAAYNALSTAMFTLLADIETSLYQSFNHNGDIKGMLDDFVRQIHQHSSVLVNMLIDYLG
jgi:hypothetical protein